MPRRLHQHVTASEEIEFECSGWLSDLRALVQGAPLQAFLDRPFFNGAGASEGLTPETQGRGVTVGDDILQLKLSGVQLCQLFHVSHMLSWACRSHSDTSHRASLALEHWRAKHSSVVASGNISAPLRRTRTISKSSLTSRGWSPRRIMKEARSAKAA